jgi:hypothetical protein
MPTKVHQFMTADEIAARQAETHTLKYGGLDNLSRAALAPIVSLINHVVCEALLDLESGEKQTQRTRWLNWLSSPNVTSTIHISADNPVWVWKVDRSRHEVRVLTLLNRMQPTGHFTITCGVQGENPYNRDVLYGLIRNALWHDGRSERWRILDGGGHGILIVQLVDAPVIVGR